MMRFSLRQKVLALPLNVVGRSYTDAKTVRKPNKFDQLVEAQNEVYVEGLLKQYEKDPSLVAPSWIPALEALQNGSTDMPVVTSFHRPSSQQTLTERERLQNMSLSWMIRAYEKIGHYLAAVNPLGHVVESNLSSLDPSALDPSSFGFTEEDLEQVFYVTFGSDFEATFVSGETGKTLKDIVAQLRRMYCGSIGFEFMPSGYFDTRNWFRQEILNSLNPLDRQDRLNIFDDVVKSCGFEHFLNLKYGTQQRFGLDGGEALIPAMKAAIQTATDNGVTSCIIGMAHRGRLNVLSNILQKSVVKIFSEFEGKAPKDRTTCVGDVKYHLGHSKRVSLGNGKSVLLEVLPNPSHLEAVNPLVLGKARARQMYGNDSDCEGVLPILIHGDAAIMGQGTCYETMGFCDLENYHVGGTLHIIINNQVGFTANPWECRSSIYCSDLSKVNNAPVLHVNGDDVEACVRACRMAALFRQEFHRDIIIDLICYRRNGHNESDLPDFTQPQLYQAIRSHPTLVDIYSKVLVKDKLITEETVKAKKKEYEGYMRQALDAAKSSQDFVKVIPHFQLASENQAEMLAPTEEHVEDITRAVETGVDIDTLRQVGMHITTIPNSVKKAHPVLQRTYAARKKAIESGDGLEWCLAELLAFGTLSLQGVSIRLSGEDVERGTFTQRHAVVVDQETNVKVTPVATLSSKQAPVTISNSSLSELGVCGFELGYNIENPSNLCMWEAQFGDFANGAQVIFDQFLSSGEEKWNMKSSYILSLPHGYSGAGPEHSSARIERYLQLSNDIDVVPSNFRKSSPAQMMETRIQKYNWQVCYPSTPANYFHMLRRQSVRPDVKPLVFFFSKARLRPPNVSSLKEMAKGTSFLPVIDTAEENTVARKVLFCSGQIESIVDDHRKKLRASNPGVHDDVVLVKVEQISPFPWEQVADVLEKYHKRNPNVEFAWLQEEPKNMGPWAYVRLRLQSLMRHLGIATAEQPLKYIGRRTAASPSTGYGSVHVEEEKEIIAQALA